MSCHAQRLWAGSGNLSMHIATSLPEPVLNSDYHYPTSLKLQVAMVANILTHTGRSSHGLRPID